MEFDYIKNFGISKERYNYIEKVLSKKQFYINKDSIIISREYPENEQNAVSENNFKKSKLNIDKKRRYYKIINKLCEKYHPFPNKVLEVGAGTGYFAKMFIKKFKPITYTMYEFSKTVKMIKNKFKNEKKININIYNKTFKNITENELKEYDCIIALEVFEHVNWDKEFLLKVKPETWIFISLPRIHSYNHVRAFLTPDSIVYRYRNILKIYEIYEVKRIIHFKSKHNYPLHWAIVSKRKLK